ncbi:MAG: sulfatase/phosphatase domain-containing protein, partial [Planctomycetota bacterium]|nr:sulfatase/phosphatase domain-containing protein [Planctomycetota bacterium]
LDRGFGMVLDVLKEKKLEENTLVIFMGDNGEALLRGKGTLYDRGTHVPLIVRWPNRIEEGSQSEALISGIDLSATILEAAGLEMHETMDGSSFLPQLLGIESKLRTHLFAERGWHWGPITRTDGLDLSRSVTSTRYRYIYNALPDRSYTPVDMSKKDAWIAITESQRKGQLSKLHQRLYFQNPRPVIELYDLENDPLELRNLSGRPGYENTELQLQMELERWMIREHDFLPLPSHAIQNGI